MTTCLGPAPWGSGGHWGKGLSQAEVASPLAQIANDAEQETSTSVFPRTPFTQPRGLSFPSASPVGRCAQELTEQHFRGASILALALAWILPTTTSPHADTSRDHVLRCCI